MTKKCTECGIVKPLEDFPKRKQMKDGRKSACRACDAKRTAEWAKNNPGRRQSYYQAYLKDYVYPHPEKRKAQYRKYKLKSKYGLTEELLQQMILDQNNQCAICSCEFINDGNDKLGRLNVDHCHITLKVRGLLCTTCNLILGKVQDDIIRLQKMIDYLKSH